MELLDRNSCIRFTVWSKFIHSSIPPSFLSFFPSFPPSFLLNVNSLVLEVRDDKRATGTGSCLSRHPFLPVLQCTETRLPSIPQSCRALPGLQVFALVVSTASKSWVCSQTSRGCFHHTFQFSAQMAPLKQGPTHPAHPQEESIWFSFYHSSLLSCFYNFLLYGKDSDAGRDWGQEEKGTTEDEMAGWHHQLDGRESEWTPGDGDGQGGLACWDSWGRKELGTTERLNWTELNSMEWSCLFICLLSDSPPSCFPVFLPSPEQCPADSRYFVCVCVY